MRHLSIAALVTVVAVAACGGDNDQAEGMPVDTADTTMQPQAAAMDTAPVFVAMIQSAQDTGNISGTVRVYALNGGAAMGGGYGGGATGPDTMAGTGPDTMSGAMAPGSTATGTGMAPDTGAMAGGAAAGGTGFRLAVEVNGLPRGEHAWHIHSGPCGEDGPVVVPFTNTADKEGIGQPLMADQTGSARATVMVPPTELTLQQLEGGQYSLHIHQQGGVDHGPTLACADLNRSGGM